jgi:hypothetical protein
MIEATRIFLLGFGVMILAGFREINHHPIKISLAACEGICVGIILHLLKIAP